MQAKNVISQVLGGDKAVLDDVSTVADARERMGLSADYSATVNGEPASGDTGLRDNDFVAFSRKVKGGQ